METNILFRISPELKEKLIQKAKSLGLNLSSYIRLTLLKSMEE